MGTEIESPGPFDSFNGDITEYSSRLDAFRLDWLAVAGNITILAGLRILEVPAGLQTLTSKSGE